MCNREECPEIGKGNFSVCCLCPWIMNGLKCEFYKCKPGTPDCEQRIAEDNLVAQWEAQHEPPDYIQEEWE